ncbi:hypothetical protein VO54_01223 [Elizabethkingia miricola]|nr:hypothetical protein VO54_01223 [Elizabethkingia miricola]
MVIIKTKSAKKIFLRAFCFYNFNIIKAEFSVPVPGILTELSMDYFP